jgi:hypothetical protein
MQHLPFLNQESTQEASTYVSLVAVGSHGHPCSTGDWGSEEHRWIARLALLKVEYIVTLKTQRFC